MDDGEQQRRVAQAEWLAELARALGEAQRLTSALARWQSDEPEAVLLRTRIKAAMAEVDALQAATGSRSSQEIEPLWTMDRARGPRADPLP